MSESSLGQLLLITIGLRGCLHMLHLLSPQLDMFSISFFLVIQEKTLYHTSCEGLSRGNTFDNDFDNALFSFPHKLECFFCFFKLETICDESLDVDFSTGYEVHGCWITANRVPN